MGVRHPSIAIASFGHNSRYSTAKQGSFPSTNPIASSSSGRRTAPQASNPTGNQLRPVQTQIQTHQEEQKPSQPHSQPHTFPGSTTAHAVVHQPQPLQQVSQPHQRGSQKSGRAGPPHAGPFVVSAGSAQTIVRTAGVKKTRRGRPRSPALVHFRRHVDDKGNFIANQCAHCTFVSRDRSENSTLLLRHLLSPACSTPEEVRVILRGNRYTADGKRTNRGGKAGAARSRKTGLKNTVGSLVDAKEHTPRRGSGQFPAAQGYSVNPEHVSAALIRFFVRHEIDLRVVESTLFTDMVEALTATAPMNERGLVKKSAASGSQIVTGECGELLPAWNVLENVWRSTAVSRLLKQDTGNGDGYSSSAHLIIYFPDCIAPLLPHCASHSSYDADKELDNNSLSMIASTFRWTSGAKLKYIGSKNCSGDFQTCLSELLSESQPNCPPGKTTFDQIFIGRPVGSLDQSRNIPRNDPVNTWIADVSREIDILGQELLSQVPLLVRCVRRNKLLASFFRETYSNSAAVILFGRNPAEKEQCRRYIAHIADPVKYTRCCDALESAEQTYEILQQAQSSHKDRQRLQETGSFLHTISEENAGNVQLCQEITRLVLSLPYRNELKLFISVMRPLANLVTLYGREDKARARSDRPTQQGHQTPADIFSDPFPFQGRSIAYLLPDCVRALRDIYTEKAPEFENDLLLLRGHTTCRLLGKGAEGFPPIVGEICYLAAFLNPNTDLSTMKGITVDEAWRRALSFLHSNYNSSSDLVLDRALEQLQSFHGRSGVFSVREMFSDANEIQDPKVWWEKHGSLAPDLCVVALKILSAPTTAFPVVQHIAEVNARELDLRRMGKDDIMEKKRILHWNLKLSEYANVSRGLAAAVGS